MLRERASLRVGEVQACGRQSRAKEAVLSAEILERFALLTPEPAGDEEHEELERMVVAHEGEMYRYRAHLWGEAG